MKPQGGIAQLVSRRSYFVVLYAPVAILAGLVNVFAIVLTSMTGFQFLVMTLLMALKFFWSFQALMVSVVLFIVISFLVTIKGRRAIKPLLIALAICVLVLFAYAGLSEPLIGFAMVIGGFGPFALIVLAFMRGRHIGNAYLFLLPVCGLVVTMIGASPLFVEGDGRAIMGSIVFAWVFDFACLYLGASRKFDQAK
jgi:hypothetical protein